MDRSVMVEVKNLKKRYRLGEIGTESFRQDLQSWWARRRGKDDPLRRIGEEQDFFYALKGLSLTFRRGESIGIIGENGAGKSTFLKLLSRVMAPTEGSIDLYGRVTSMLEVGTGFDGELTGRENIYMNGAILGMTKSEIDAKIEEIIEFSELREFIDTPVKRYSSGMYTKLGFAVASHLDMSENCYTLYSASKDMYFNTDHVSLSDIFDTKLIPEKMFNVIITAINIRRLGLTKAEAIEYAI